jgi:ubiquinone/menaquinone biosynthesis C-methylase UbiE
MGLYQTHILPQLMDWAMASPTLAAYRKALLADLSGEVLEIGFGTGLNLAYYPDAVQRLTTVDINPGMHALARRRIAASSLAVDHQVLNSEALPMADSTFDWVVSTWTLCSIAKVEPAINEIYRVLKPGGRFVFIEHGLSQRPEVQTWQHRLTPLQRIIGGGCHLDRNIAALVGQSFEQITVRQFVPEGLPALAATLYQGLALKPAAS